MHNYRNIASVAFIIIFFSESLFVSVTFSKLLRNTEYGFYCLWKQALSIPHPYSLDIHRNCVLDCVRASSDSRCALCPSHGRCGNTGARQNTPWSCFLPMMNESWQIYTPTSWPLCLGSFLTHVGYVIYSLPDVPSGTEP